MDRALDVDALVKGWLVKAWSNTGACRQVDDLIEGDGSQQGVEGRAVKHVAMDKDERFFERLDCLEVSALEIGMIEIIQVIEGPDSVAGLQQPFAEMRADETGPARHQEIHAAAKNRGEGTREKGQSQKEISERVGRLQNRVTGCHRGK